MTEKRYYKKEYEEEYYIFDSNTLTEKEFEKKVEYDGYSVFADSLTPEEVLDLLNENEELKQQLSDCKKEEKQLSISFMEFKIQLIEVLQQNYNYAYNQRQKNLDKSLVARNYELLYQTMDNIAETMNVDIERFPKGDVE